MNNGRATPRLFAFPKSGIAYNDCLYVAAQKHGLTVIDGEWAGRWLWANVRNGDVIHIHWPSFLYYDARSAWNKLIGVARFFLLYTVIKLRGGRVVWTAHNLYPHDGGRAEWTHRLVRRFIARNASLVIVHGPTARTLLKAEFGIPDKHIAEVLHGNWIGYHPNTIDKAEARRVLGIPAATYVYCIVGACRPYKNLEALITAFKRLDSDSFLLIAGQFQSQDYRSRIEGLLADIPRSRFRLFAEFIDRDAVQNYVVAGDAFVVPYTEILTSGSAMLGLSFGVPVVAPKLGSLIDLVDGQSGLLYDASGPDALLGAMLEVRQRSYSRERILAHARRFDWNISARALIEAVQAIA